MSYLTAEEGFDFLAGEIKARFMDTQLGFFGRLYPQKPELKVYVGDHSKLGEVQAFCRELEQRRIEPSLPIAIIVEPGPLPDGETLEQIFQKRDEFLKRHRQTQAV